MARCNVKAVIIAATAFANLGCESKSPIVGPVVIYPLHQESASWSCTGQIAYRDNGIICIYEQTGSFLVDPALAGIWVIDPNEGNKRQIIKGGFDPRWSRDGSKLVFENGYVYTSDGNGANVKQVTDEVGAFSPCWSPDGSWIAYDSNDMGGSYGIWRSKSDGMGKELLVANGRTPDWSPSGEAIIFVRYVFDSGTTKGLYKIVECALRDRSERIIVSMNVVIKTPRYSIDATRVLFGGGVSRLYVVNRDGSELTELMDEAEWGEWSPDGNSVVYTDGNITTNSPESGVLWIKDCTTHLSRQITNRWPFSCQSVELGK